MEIWLLRHRKTRRITVSTFFERRTGTNNRGTLERTVDLIHRGLPVTRQEAPGFPQVREMMFVITESKQSKPLQRCWWGFPYECQATRSSPPLRRGSLPSRELTPRRLRNGGVSRGRMFLVPERRGRKLAPWRACAGFRLLWRSGGSSTRLIRC